MEITKISTKGQVVIPESIRKGIEVGTPFIVSKTSNMIILKKVEGLTEKEKKELKELDKIWQDIDNNKGTTLNLDNFLKEINSW